MKHGKLVCIMFLFVALMTGCASSLSSIRMTSDQTLGKPLDATFVSYTNTYFQPRFMGLRPLLVGPVLWYAGGSFEGRESQRLQSSDFEKLLAEFNVFEYFDGQLKKRAGETSMVILKFSDSPDLTSKVIEVARCDQKDACTSAAKSLGEATPNIAALKMSYGLGARQGSEQLGFRKYYRPFIRVIGVIKKVPSTETIWQSDILVFAENRYLGGDADADRIPREELISSFKILATQAIDLLVRSLNGEVLPEMHVMADTAASDLNF